VDQTTQREIERKISAAGVAVDRIECGRIVESRNTLDVLYWLHNIQLLSRDPSFVELLPGLRTCPPCPGKRRCINGVCVTPPHTTE
jgi:transcriptional regulator with XRE-family HTH domain